MLFTYLKRTGSIAPVIFLSLLVLHLSRKGTSGPQAGTNGVMQGSILSTVLFNFFINSLNTGLEGILSRCIAYTRLGGAVNSLEDREALRPCRETCTNKRAEEPPSL